jgi:hypothetical protein
MAAVEEALGKMEIKQNRKLDKRFFYAELQISGGGE